MAVLAPSVLAADFSRLGEEVAACERGGATRLHVDVMDNHFVPNLTMGPDLLAACRRSSSLFIEAHLMIYEPDRLIPSFVEAGADLITVHWEAVAQLHRTVELIRDSGAAAGVGVNPATPVVWLRDILPRIAQALVMSVDPGFGGQAFLPATLERVRELRQLIDGAGLQCDIEVDGGVGAEQARDCLAAGATVLVAGSSVFHHPEGTKAGAACLLRAMGGPTTGAGL